MTVLTVFQVNRDQPALLELPELPVPLALLVQLVLQEQLVQLVRKAYLDHQASTEMMAWIPSPRAPREM
jgi:hypothetical protein